MDNTNRFYKKNVVITGGSSGIGFEIALQFAELGANLFLIARNRERIEKAQYDIHDIAGKEIKVHILTADVGIREEIESSIHRVGKEHGGIHTLINNVGISLWGTLENNSIEELERVMRINYFGMLYAIKAAWPYLKAAGDGHIGFVSSVSGYLGAIGYGSYSPTKFAVTGLAECLRMEAADYNIGVTIVFPPDTDTPMLAEEQKHTLPECKALSTTSGSMSAREVARRFLDGICNYQFEVFCNWESRWLRIWKAIWPSRYYRFLDDVVAKDRRRRAV